MNTKYNYVFFNVSDPCYDPVLWPLEKHSFVKVYKYAIDSSPLINKLFFLHWSKKINKKIKLPFKKAWFKRIIQQPFENDKPCCYVFLGGKYLCEETALYRYIKSLNPQNKAVVLCGDLISKKNWDMEKVRSCCDMILTYDEGESKTYGANYYPWLNIYGARDEVTTPDTFENDVYFIGFAKDRLSQIHSAFKALSEKKLKCKFIVCGTDEKDRICAEGLTYSSPLSYKENVKNIQNSRCILEILQGGGSSPTLRLYEAVTYKRKLITNNIHPSYKEQLSPSNLLIYQNPEEISEAFATESVDYDGFTSGAENPLKFISYFEENL